MPNPAFPNSNIVASSSKTFVGPVVADAGGTGGPETVVPGYGIFEPLQTVATTDEIEAGTETSVRSWSPFLINLAVQAELERAAINVQGTLLGLDDVQLGLEPVEGDMLYWNGFKWNLKADSAFAAAVHTHDGLYAALDHDHSGVYQPVSLHLTALDSLVKTDGGFLVGDGTTWTVETGATARASLGLNLVENIALSTWTGSSFLSIDWSQLTSVPEGTFAEAVDSRIDLQKAQASGLATLDESAKLPADQLPEIAKIDVHKVGSEATMLALDAQQGDWCIRIDTGQVFALRGADPAHIENWEEMSRRAIAEATSLSGSEQLAVWDGTVSKYIQYSNFIADLINEPDFREAVRDVIAATFQMDSNINIITSDEEDTTTVSFSDDATLNGGYF